MVGRQSFPQRFVVGLAYQNFPAEAATTLQAQE